MRHERYQRQTLIPYWDQRRLAASHLLIVGSNSLAAVIAAGAVALGVGRVTLLDDAVVEAGQPRHFLCVEAATGIPCVRAMEAALRIINPEVTVSSVMAELVHEVQLMTLTPPHVLIVASGRAEDVEICMAFAQERGVPLVVAVAGTTEGACAIWMPGTNLTSSLIPHPSPLTNPPSMAVSCVTGGLALSEARACLLPLWRSDYPAPRALHYDSLHPQRFPVNRRISESANHDSPIRPYAHTPIRHLVLVGAGGLGTWFALAAASEAAVIGRLTVFDGDVIAEHNLNRQVLYADATGQPKARVLSDKLRLLNPSLCVDAVEERISPDFLRAHRSEADGVVAAVDNFATRDLLQDACGQSGLPLINGGSGALQAEVAVYAPGQSACLHCTMDLRRLAQEESAQPASCAAAPEPSTVITNMIAGGLMAGEVRNLFTDPPNVPRGVLVYDATSPIRVGLRSQRTPCCCY